MRRRKEHNLTQALFRATVCFCCWRILTPCSPAQAAAAPSPVRIEKTQYQGWDVYRLTNGIISLDIAPQIGGRAIQLRLGEKEFFFVNPDFAGKVLPESQNNLWAGWANYG